MLNLLVGNVVSIRTSVRVCPIWYKFVLACHDKPNLQLFWMVPTISLELSHITNELQGIMVCLLWNQCFVRLKSNLKTRTYFQFQENLNKRNSRTLIIICYESITQRTWLLFGCGQVRPIFFQADSHIKFKNCINANALYTIMYTLDQISLLLPLLLSSFFAGFLPFLAFLLLFLAVRPELTAYHNTTPPRLNLIEMNSYCAAKIVRLIKKQQQMLNRSDAVIDSRTRSIHLIPCI